MFDEEDDMWKLTPATKAQGQYDFQHPVASSGFRRPATEFAKMAAMVGGNPRYKGAVIFPLQVTIYCTYFVMGEKNFHKIIFQSTFFQQYVLWCIVSLLCL